MEILLLNAYKIEIYNYALKGLVDAGYAKGLKFIFLHNFI